MKKSFISNRDEILSSEKGAYALNPEGKVKCVVVYPNFYRVGMSNLGFQTVYGILNERKNIVCERAFLPEYDAWDKLGKKGNDLLSLESLRALRDFHIIFFSASFENDYINILKILEYSGIPLRREERDERAPLVAVGGIAVSSNPEPLSDFMDVFLLGDAESILPSFCKRIDGASGGEKKEYYLKAISKVRGAYLPSSEKNEDETVSVSRLDDMNESSSYSRIITPLAEFSSMHLVEMSRGCASACRFCLLGNYYGSPRVKSLEKVFGHIDYGMRNTGRVGLVSCFTGKGERMSALREGIEKRKIEVSFSSIRFEDLNDDFIKFISESGQQTITLAPECGNELLRYSAGKKISDEEIVVRISSISANGVKNIKLYFMVGFPGETLGDVKDIALLVKKIKKASERKSAGLRIFVSVSSFVPKPFTPLQWSAMDNEKTLKTKLSSLRSAFSKMNGVIFNCDLPKYARIQGVFSRGDRKTGDILLNALKFDGDWKKAMRESEINADYYVHRERKADEAFPWDFIDAGVSKKKLRDIYMQNFSL